MVLSFTPTFELNNSPNDILLKDTTDWIGQGLTLSQVSIIFQLSSPVGIFHAGDTTYVTPDIVRASADTFVNNLPLDVKGKVITGTYNLKMSAKITAQSFTFNVVSVDQANKLFGVTGNALADILNATGGTITVTGTNAGTYTIVPANCSYDSVNNITYIAVSTAISSPTVDGTVTYTVDKYYSITNTTNFCFVEPEIKFDITSDCSTGVMSAVDTTDYTATICGNSPQEVVPASISRIMTLVYPTDPLTGLPVASNIVAGGDTINVTAPNLWTGDYQITIETLLTYILNDGSVVVVNLTGYSHHTIECDNSLCCALQCIENLYHAWINSLKSGIQQGKSFTELIKVMGEWLIVTQAHQCGDMDKYFHHLAKLIALVKATNCNCCPETTTAPVRVVPLLGGGSNSNTITIVTPGTGITITSVTVGVTTTYQVSLDMTVVNAAIVAQLALLKLGQLADVTITSAALGQVLTFDPFTNKWFNTNIGLAFLNNVDMVTNPPQNGYALTWNSGTGKAEFQPTILNNVLDNDIADSGTDAAITEKILKTYTIPANTLNNGDSVVIKAMFKNNPDAGYKVTRKIKLNGAALPFIAALVVKPLTDRVEMEVTRLTASTYFIEYTYFNGQLPTAVWSNIYTTGSIDFTNPIVVTVTGQNQTTTANQIIAKYLKCFINHK